MAKIVKSLSLDVSTQNRIQAIVAKQYDKDSRFLKIQLTDEGEPIAVDKSSVVMINVSRADNASKAFAGEVNEDGTVTVPITYWMLELNDRVGCDVSVVDDQGRKLSTLNFTIEVERSNHPGDDISEDENYDLLVTLLSEVAEAKDSEAKRAVAENTRITNETARQAAEESRVVAEQSRVTSEDGRVNSEIQRESAESARIANETARQTAEEERVAAEQAREEELNNKLDKSDIVQTTGQSTEAVMSQKAVTDYLESKVEKPTSVSSVTRLYGVKTNSKDTVFFQVQTSNPYKDSIPKRGANGTFAVGTPKNLTDAVNKEYVDNKFFRQKYISTLELYSSDSYEPTATGSSSIISIVCTSGDVFITGTEGENYANLSCNDPQNPPFATITAIGNQIMIQTGFISAYDSVYGGEICDVTTKFALYGDFLSHTAISYLFVSTNDQATIDIFRGE